MPDVKPTSVPVPPSGGSRPVSSAPTGAASSRPSIPPPPAPKTPSGASQAAASSVPAGSANGGAGDPQIHVIPEKFYGAALRANIVEREKAKIGGQADQAPAKRRAWVVPVIASVVLLLGVAGGFVYFNQSLLFPKPAPPPPVVVTPPPPPPPPEAATNLSATATSPTLVRLTWTDVAADEATYRIERRDSVNAYGTIRNLAPNESSYDDPTVSADQDYLYRVVAVNGNGETASTEVSVRTPPTPPPPPEAPVLPPAGLDSDSDGLTDLEEPLYGSPLRDPDADKDSYNDGNEVFHLYSPSGKAPGRLLESGLVKKVESPVGWSVFAPSSWQVLIDPDGRKGTVMTGHGEIFQASVENREPGQTVLDWYLASHPGVLSSQVRAITTQSGFEGIEGAEQLTAYFAWGDYVFILRYDLDGQPFVNFRTTYEMMKNSLSLSAVPALPGAGMTEDSEAIVSDESMVPSDTDGAGAASSTPEEGEVTP